MGGDKGIGVESLRKSREIRADFLRKFAQIPSSILVHDRHDRAMDLITKGRGGGYEGFRKKVRKKVTKSSDYMPGLESTGFELYGRRNFLSSFPQNVGRILIETYCPKNGLIYDPFAGHNSRMELCFKCGRDYIGVDCSKDFMAANRKIRNILLDRGKRGLFSSRKVEVTLIEGSSDKVDLPDNSADFTITSPPYWDIECYGDESEQLGNAKTYERFLELLSIHIKENFRVLKSGSFCCWFINDFRKDGKFYAFHSDLYRVFEEKGFAPFNIYIVDLGNPIGQAFVQTIIKTRIFPKRYEYILVFRKPEVEEE